MNAVPCESIQNVVFNRIRRDGSERRVNRQQSMRMLPLNTQVENALGEKFVGHDIHQHKMHVFKSIAKLRTRNGCVWIYFVSILNKINKKMFAWLFTTAFDAGMCICVQDAGIILLRHQNKPYRRVFRFRKRVYCCTLSCNVLLYICAHAMRLCSVQCVANACLLASSPSAVFTVRPWRVHMQHVSCAVERIRTHSHIGGKTDAMKMHVAKSCGPQSDSSLEYMLSLRTDSTATVNTLPSSSLSSTSWCLRS